MTIKFYYWPRSSATRIHWALEELGVPYDKVRLDREKGENRTPEFLAISPQGNIPALVDGDATFFESVAILTHLGQTYGAEKGVWPRLAADAARALSWTVWSSTELGVQRISYAVQTLDAPFALPKEARNPIAAERSKSLYNDRIAVLEKQLEGHAWLVGSAFSLADIAVGQLVSGAQTRMGLSIANSKNVSAWVERCTARPAYVKVMAET